MSARRESGVSMDDESPSFEVTPPSGGGRSRGRDGKEKESFGCPFPGCGQAYSRMEYLKRHQRKHQDVRPFQCKDCSKAFARSDVLLRHRRRCHPTPPPPDRASTSPPAHLSRAYPGVPVSSSRTDAADPREASPSFYPPRSRKHPRQSSSSSHDGQPPQRHRASMEDDDDADDRYGERNGMGNGGVYGAGGYFGSGQDGQDSSTYTPHLLPMFQQASAPGGFHNLSDANHLEDASVLLSMAYPGGLPNANAHSSSSSSTNGPTAPTTSIDGPVAEVPDWAAGQTINMMMEQAGRDRPEGPATGTTAEAEEAANVALGEAMGNFLGTMNWLSPGVPLKPDTPSDAAPQWNLNSNSTGSSPRPLTPFPLSSLFSPSVFGLTSLPEAPANGDGIDDEEGQQAVQALLDQLTAYDRPQTKANPNPNPERPLLRLESENMVVRAGKEASRTSKYYLAAERFAGCYQIPHWALPPLRTLSLLGQKTCNTVLNHFQFVHMPTFNLPDTAACLAFAICTVGGIKSSNTSYDAGMERLVTYGKRLADGDMGGPVVPGQSWESMYETNLKGVGSGVARGPDRVLEEGEEYDEEDLKRSVEGWANAQIVRNEKTNMLVKSFSLAQGVLMTEYNVALLQALILYHTPYFLSEDENERTLANMFLGTIVNISRQIGFFTPELEHFESQIQLPIPPYAPNDLNMHWRRWIQLESRRRTAYIVYHLDTVSALESNIPCILSPCELAYIPLPAPDSLWKAATAEEWYRAAKTYRPMNLDEAMRRSFFLPTYGTFDTIHEKADTMFYCLLNETEMGPFARVAMILTLLRGIMDIGEGKRDRGDWRDLTDLWVSCSWLKPGKKILDAEGNDLGQVTRDSLRERFKHALERWREGWDFDAQCPSPASTASSVSAMLAGNSISPSGTTSSNGSPNSTGASGPAKYQLNYCEEALPFYWLAQALLNILKSAPPHEPGWNVFGSGLGGGNGGIKYGEMLKSARRFTRMGEGVGVGVGVGVGGMMGAMGMGL